MTSKLSLCSRLVPLVFAACSEYFSIAGQKKGQFRGDCLFDCQLSTALLTCPTPGHVMVGRPSAQKHDG